MYEFNERTNTLLYKNIPPILYSKGLLNCGSQRVASPQSASWFSRWHLVSQLTRTTTGTATDLPKPSVAPGYIIVWRPPTSCGRSHLPNSTASTGQSDIPMSSTGCTCFAVLPLIYTGAPLDWRLGRGSICYTICILENYNLRNLVANIQDSDIVISKFEIQWRNYVYFRTNTLKKGKSSVIPLKFYLYLASASLQ